MRKEGHSQHIGKGGARTVCSVSRNTLPWIYKLQYVHVHVHLHNTALKLVSLA
jgi:hypothetical protein